MTTNATVSETRKFTTKTSNQCSTDAILAITDVTGYVRVITLLAQDEVNLLQQLNTCSKQTIKWNKYRSGITKMKTTI